MNVDFEADIWQLWDLEIKTACEKSYTLCIAVFSDDGELQSANSAMKLLFQDSPKESFINPEFDTLVNMSINESPAFNGFITIGNRNSTKNVSIKAKVFKKSNQLLIVGEVDVDQILFVSDKLFELNREVNFLQRKLIKEKMELKKTLDQLSESQEKIIQSELQIRSMLSEKELLLKEVHHRIKNNMITIKGLLFLQADSLKDQSAIAALNDAQNRVDSMMILYDKLYRSEGFREISVKEYLPELIDEILSNFSNRDIVKVEKNIDDFKLDAEVLFPIGIITNELLTNMMKYAFENRTSGIIKVSASKSNNLANIVIEDNGIGFPDSINFENSTGFGMQLISMLTEQISGIIKIERGEGTKFVIEFEVK